MKILKTALIISSAISFAMTLLSSHAIAESEFFVEQDINVLLTIEGEEPGGSFGWVASGLGDINGDGADDFITTDPFINQFLGKAYIYSGVDGILLNVVNGSDFVVLGYSATNAGDVDGDGINDYILGGSGGAEVYSGATHKRLYQWLQQGEFFGSSVSGAGDLNNDGFADLVVGARDASGTHSISGRINAYSGADGQLLWSTYGKSAEDQIGTALGSVDDVNNDGIADIVAGARGAGHKNRGEAYVLSGADGSFLYTMNPVGHAAELTDGAGVTAGTFALFHASGAGDVNGDGISDIYIGDYAASRGNKPTGRSYIFSGKNGKQLYVFDAENNGDGFGPGRGVGDINGDGYADIYNASYTYTGDSFVGKGYLRSGYDGSVLRTMTGTVSGVYLGVDALVVGDVNKDGKQDFMLTGFGNLHIISGQ